MIPKINYLIELVSKAKNVVILDHHKSSESMIVENKDKLDLIPNLYIEFDMNRSGCQMSWDYFFDNAPRPFFIDYMGDRDLWTWKLSNSKEINIGLWELGYIDSRDLTKLTSLLNEPNSKIEYLTQIGKLIEIKNKRELIAKDNGKLGLILLAGNMLTLGITLSLCDLVILMNNALSSSVARKDSL